MRSKQTSDYNHVAIWTVAVCFASIIGYFTLNAFVVHGWIPGLTSKDLGLAFRALPIIGSVGLIQCFRIGCDTVELMFLNLDGVRGPHDPRILEFEEQNKRHGRWLTALVGLGSSTFLSMIFMGVLMSFQGL